MEEGTEHCEIPHYVISLSSCSLLFHDSITNMFKKKTNLFADFSHLCHLDQDYVNFLFYSLQKYRMGSFELRKILLLRYSSFLPSWKTPSLTSCSLQHIAVRYNRVTPKMICHVTVLHCCTLTRKY